MRRKIKRLAILASGSGTTLQAVIDSIEKGELKQEIVIVISDNPDAYAITRAKNYNIETYILKSTTKDSRDEELYRVLKRSNIDLVLLLGYLKLVGHKTVSNFCIINTHPSLIPKYCGKGMHGMYVHEAVVANKEHESGVTLHFVNEKYDDGMIIWQTSVPVFSNDTADDLAKRVQMVEKVQLIYILMALEEGKLDIPERL